MPHPRGVRFFVFMKLKVNGEEITTGAETIRGLIEEFRLEPQGVAVEVNLSVISRKDYDSFRLSEGDTVEIVNFVGGG